jgi:hypothetical protein
VPFLVLLPLIESNGGMEGASADTLLKMLGPTAATTMAGLGALLLGGRVVLRRVFEVRWQRACGCCCARRHMPPPDVC